MGFRLSKIYTKTGDQGTTGLGDGSRIAKTDDRVAAFGDIDELNSALGMVLSSPKLPDAVKQCLIKVQNDLFDLGGELCMPGHQAITDEYTTRLEQQLDEFNQDLKPLKDFILPGGSLEASRLHLARAICRRAERQVWRVAEKEDVNAAATAYLNRLSDLLFVLARWVIKQQGSDEVLWQK
ncbi:MAG: cob(I)yrinic acid a,c-diamide adenosyltransferase [Gammaproteobacteria bacterium]|nr:cob(I)yrinic acid a,c-diamide adenosyltransferase [Gammaproteobacteria bacterium]